MEVEHHLQEINRPKYYLAAAADDNWTAEKQIIYTWNGANQGYQGDWGLRVLGVSPNYHHYHEKNTFLCNCGNIKKTNWKGATIF